MDPPDAEIIDRACCTYGCSGRATGAYILPRYYFHIRRNGTLDPDPEGTVFNSIGEAVEDARLAAREIMADRLLKGEPLNGDTFEIADEKGDIVEFIPFQSVVRLH